MSKNKIILTVAIALALVIAGGFFISAVTTNIRASNQVDLGMRYLTEGKYEEAILAFEQAIQIDPRSIDARVGLGKVYMELKQFADAEDILKEAMEIDKTRPEPYIHLAKLYILQERYIDAIEILERGYSIVKDDEILRMINELKPSLPEVSLESGTYSEQKNVEIQTDNEGISLYYTLDGTIPNMDSQKYTNPIGLPIGESTLKVVAINEKGIASEVAEKSFNIEIEEYEVEFKDKAFEIAIRKIIDKPEGEILNTELALIEEIHIIGTHAFKEWPEDLAFYTDEEEVSYTINGEEYNERGQIKLVDDVRLLPNLKQLDLCHNNITDVSALSSMTNLEGVWLAHNNITDISPLSNLTNLKLLDLWSNNITDISALSNLTNLKWLNLHYNNITDISALSNMTNLEELWLGSNNITDISPLSNLTNLKLLDLWGNNITDYSVLDNLPNIDRARYE